MISSLFDGAVHLTESMLLPYGLVGLFLLSFFNSSVSPIPTEVLLVPLVMLAPEEALLYGTVATAASVLGAWFGYYLGAYGRGIRYVVRDEHFEAARRVLDEHGIVIVGISGVSPLPFKLFCITSGVFRLDLRKVLGVSLLFRGARFYGIAVLLALYGDPMVAFVQENLWSTTALLSALLLGGYLASRRLMTVEPAGA